MNVLKSIFFAAACVTGLGVAGTVRAEAVDCMGDAATWGEAAAHNARTLHVLEWEPFGPEVGWEAYVPAFSHEIGTACAPDTPGFAAAVAAFQTRYELEADGVFGPASFQVLKGLWQERRPFVMARVREECPRAPERRELVEFDRTEETVQRPGRMVRAEAREAYRRMVADARAEVPEIAADPLLLTVFSTYRHPDIDAVRCEDDRNCDGRRRAACSAHRTGWALDIHVGSAPGFGIDSTRQPNRLHQSRGAAYRWLVANAGRYGFVNYIYEPWHWEYVGAGADYAP